MEASQPDDSFASAQRRTQPPAPRRRRPPPPREPTGDLLKRRFIAFLIGAAVVVALLFLVKGCLNARKERAYDNYLRDLDALVTTSSQLSDEFFGRFRDPGGATELEFQAQLGSSRGTAEDILKRAEGLDTPGDLKDAQSDLDLAFELRRDGVTSIVEQAEVALGEKNSLDAIDAIASDMREFLASDVLYERARSEITDTLDEQGIDGEVPASTFLPEPIDFWLDRLQIDALLAQVAGETGAAGDTTRGTELSSVIIRPGNVPLSSDTLNQLSKIPTEIEIGVLNGGVNDETDVQVSYELLGSTEPIQGEMPIARINPGETASVALPIVGEIPSGDELTLIVTVFPVPGESIIDNNELTYQVQFGG